MNYVSGGGRKRFIEIEVVMIKLCTPR